MIGSYASSDEYTCTFWGAFFFCLFWVLAGFVNGVALASEICNYACVWKNAEFTLRNA